MNSYPAVAALAVFITGIQLRRRFAERRPFSSMLPCLMFIGICLLSGLIAGVVTFMPVSRVGVLGLAAPYPFYAPRPGSGGQLRNGTNSRGLLAQAIEAVWAVTGFMAERLDSKLSQLKSETCSRLVDKIESTYDDGGVGIPSFERVQGVLKDWAENLTDERVRKNRLASLREAYEASKKVGSNTLGPLVGLVYDWRLEGLVCQLDISRTGLALPDSRTGTSPS
jgi:hypothetical protein